MQGALGGHVFGAQHIQQLQVIQRLQQQRAAMLAAKAAQSNQQVSSGVCVECAECSECAAKQFQEGKKYKTKFNFKLFFLGVSCINFIKLLISCNFLHNPQYKSIETVVEP